MLQLATAVECPHQLKPSNRHTSCPGSRTGAPVYQRANPAVAVIRYWWRRAVGFIRTAIGCVCCWAVMCCVRAGHVAAGVAARRHMIRPEERVLIIPVVVDRSNDSPFLYDCVWCYCCGVPSSTETKQQTDTDLARAREQGRRSVKGLI